MFTLLIPSLVGCTRTVTSMQHLESPQQNSSVYAAPESWKDPGIIRCLQTAEVTAIEPIRKFLTNNGKQADYEGEVYIVTLARGIKAVFKPVSAHNLGDPAAEVAAYRASLHLGFPYIPPTVIRTIPIDAENREGSLQLYIHTEVDLLIGNIYQQAIQEMVPVKEQIELKTFYFIFGQADTGAHNLLLFKDAAAHFISIDHAGLRVRQYVQWGELPFVRMLYSDQLNTNDWDKPFPFDRAETMDNPTVEKLKQRFGDCLPTTFYQNFKFYANEPFKFVCYRNALWRQHLHPFEPKTSFFNGNYPDILAAIKKLDLPTLKKIFEFEKGADFINDAHLCAILERRDQLVNGTSTII